GEADILDRHFGGVHVVGLNENLPLSVCAVSCRRAELFALEILRPGNAKAFARHDGEGRPVIQHEYGLDRSVGVGVAELDERMDATRPARTIALRVWRNDLPSRKFTGAVTSDDTAQASIANNSRLCRL